jgi:hypothetical protein
VSEEKSLHGNFKKYGFIKKATPEGVAKLNQVKLLMLFVPLWLYQPNRYCL